MLFKVLITESIQQKIGERNSIIAKVCLEIAVWISYTFVDNFGIKNNFIKYFKEVVGIVLNNNCLPNIFEFLPLTARFYQYRQTPLAAQNII